jgi:hypothetical protein
MVVRNCERRTSAAHQSIGVPMRGPPYDLQIKELNSCEIQYTRTVHGSLQTLPKYVWAILPTNAIVDSKTSRRLFFPASHNISAVILAIIQVGAGCITLYRTRGDQLETYGFASFVFTVLPYVIMSLVNLVGNVVTPIYQSLHMVSSYELEEAEQFGQHREATSHQYSRFDGTIGKLVQTESDPSATARFQQAGDGTWSLKFLESSSSAPREPT